MQVFPCGYQFAIHLQEDRRLRDTFPSMLHLRWQPNRAALHDTFVPARDIRLEFLRLRMSNLFHRRPRQQLSSWRCRWCPCNCPQRHMATESRQALQRDDLWSCRVCDKSWRLCGPSCWWSTYVARCICWPDAKPSRFVALHQQPSRILQLHRRARAMSAPLQSWSPRDQVCQWCWCGGCARKLWWLQTWWWYRALVLEPCGP